jgi:hypothetical protein
MELDPGRVKIMPITISHTPIGALTQLAIISGKARAQELTTARDLQLTQIALEAQGRAAQSGAFGLQRAGARQIAERRPATQEVVQRRIDLKGFVSKAKSAGIYDPAQLKQAEIFAEIGDESAVRSILGELPRPVAAPAPTARQRELQRQSDVLKQTSDAQRQAINAQLDAINKRLQNYTPGMQQLILERPELQKTVEPEIVELISQKQNLLDSANALNNTLGKMQQSLSFGISIPEQIAAEQKSEEAALREQQRKENQRINVIVGIKRAEITGQLKIISDPISTQAEQEAASQKIVEITDEISTLIQGGSDGVRKATDAEKEQALGQTRGDVEAARQLLNDAGLVE